MQFKRRKRNVNGLLLLDKPIGISSNQALQKAKWLFQAEKAGHTGTLDPLATGLLPICFGEATKFAHYLTDADKTYVATLRLGVTTNTGDAEGEVLEIRDVNVSRIQLEQACRKFIGEIYQVPPMFSALKYEGKALYEYARAGIEIERKSRLIKIHQINVESLEQDIVVITITCSKGTYIRTLSEDIGNILGCGSHLVGLRRTATANFMINQTFLLEQLESMSQEQRDALLLPSDTPILHLPAIILDGESTYFLKQGQSVWKNGLIPNGFLRLYDEHQIFLGLGELASDGKISPKRLIRQSEN